MAILQSWKQARRTSRPKQSTAVKTSTSAVNNSQEWC